MPAPADIALEAAHPIAAVLTTARYPGSRSKRVGLEAGIERRIRVCTALTTRSLAHDAQLCLCTSRFSELNLVRVADWKEAEAVGSRPDQVFIAAGRRAPNPWHC
jgi:hypothetical protein